MLNSHPLHSPMLYRYPLVIALLLLPLIASQLDAQIWQWGRKGGSQGGDSVARIATDRNGNSVVIGTYFTSADFGAIRVDNSIGTRALFVVLYNASGTPQWGATNGGAGVIIPGDVAYDRSGNVLVTGSFRGTISFGSTVLATAGENDMFLVKFTPNGVVVWARRGGGTESDVATGVAIDSLDNPVVTGWFGGTARFDTSEIVSRGGTDIFLAKYDPLGGVMYTRSDGGAGEDTATCIGLDGTGSIVIAGYFKGSSLIGGDTVISADTGSPDLFAARYTPTGTAVWGRRGGGIEADGANGIAVDRFGSAWVTGFFSDTARFGPTGLRSHGARDVLLLRYDAVGTVRWSTGGGGAGDDEGGDVVLDEAGTSYMIGTVVDTALFAPQTVVDPGNGDMVMIRYNSSGELQWVQSGGGAGSVAGRSIGIDRFNELYITGTFRGTARFGSVMVTAGTVPDMYIAKFGSDASVAVGSVSPGPYCPEAQLSIPYTVTGTFQPGNIFAAELSDSIGSFLNPRVIGTRVSTTSGILVASIPLSTPPGSRYRIRLTGSLPGRIGTENAIDIGIVANPKPVVTPSGPIALCQGETVTLDAGEGYIFYQWSTGATSRTITTADPGGYTVTVGNSAGCTGVSGPVTVTVHPATATPTIKQLTTNLLESSSSDFYQWYRNGDTIPGATNRTLFATLSGLYQVRVTLENGCSAISEPLEILFASVDDIALQNGIRLVPNPVVNEFTITVPVEAGDRISLRVVDALGRQVMEVDDRVDGSGEWRRIIDTQSWSNGEYFIVVDRNGKRAVAQVVRNGG